MGESIATLIGRAEGGATEPPVSIARIRASTDPREQAILGKELGEANELRLLRVLSAGPLPRWIASVRRGTREEDRRGADLVATLRTGREVPIQVKSSGLRALEFIEEHRARTGGREWTTAIVVVREGETDAELLERAVGLVAALLTPRR